MVSFPRLWRGQSASEAARVAMQETWRLHAGGPTGSLMEQSIGSGFRA